VFSITQWLEKTDFSSGPSMTLSYNAYLYSKSIVMEIKLHLHSNLEVSSGSGPISPGDGGLGFTGSSNFFRIEIKIPDSLRVFAGNGYVKQIVKIAVVSELPHRHLSSDPKTAPGIFPI
jgi:hypothetical protein